MKKIGQRKTGGRNNQGRITVRHIGGGHKRNYRELEYRDGEHIEELSGKIIDIEYDPNRTAYLAVCEGSGRKYYKRLGSKHKIGGRIEVVEVGRIPVGGEIYNVSLGAGKQGQMALARGASCKVVKQEETTTVIRMPSSAIKRISSKSKCIEGEVVGKAQTRLGKAGAARRLGIRPSVRGVAMNPIDHPNGGKTHSCKIKNKFGKLAKWIKTRSNKVRK